ncbi:SRPBCC family protein [Natranaeroarchaeum aerophilus]|uniref:SRPBCC family protein n=1 Tax=Natranaeroarchaeum aerophilus TaxID=2917711 RepID=A0AAE3FQB2_9EURY|nr:SRPBCC family protein [Natranaeroarchaeum aerophilus]MCL9813682.1 SRPBCC family protein [Natranaeroarchaeum aerophilus]
MSTVSETIHVPAPVDEVFAFLDDPNNHMAVTPSIADIDNVERLENGGKRLDHTFRMAGVALDGELVQTVHEPDERMVFEMRGRLEGEIGLQFEAEDGGTRLTYAATYEIPGNVLSAVAAPFARRYNERELRTTLENVQTHFEVAG